jgi:lipopolysaccharide transport system ATP-binding protein
MRRGDGRAQLTAIETLDTDGNPVSAWQSGETARIRVSVRFAAAVADPVIGIMIRTRIGMEVYGTNTELEKLKLGPCEAGETRAVTFEFECNLCPQLYTITAASHDPDGVWHDWMEDAISFSVADSRYTAGVANLRARVTCSKD